MKIVVKAKAGAKEDKVVPPPLKLIPDEEPVYTVHVRAAAREGRANDAIIRLLANHFDLPRSRIRLLLGATSKRKLFEVDP